MTRLIRSWLVAAFPARLRARLRHLGRPQNLSQYPLQCDVWSERSKYFRARTSDGREICILPETATDLKTHFQGEHAPEIHTFLHFARSPGVLFDAGASNGFFSLFYCASHPQNRAVGFEPSELFRNRIREMVELNRMSARLTVEPFALGAVPGESELWFDPDGGFVQVGDFPGTARERMRRTLFQTRTIDGECARLGLIPTVVKIDIEGNEWEALQGATKLLGENPPVIFLELHLNYLEHRGIQPQAVTDLLERFGYTFFSHDGRRLSARKVSGSWQPVVRVVARPPANSGRRNSEAVPAI